jgi:hypothetical protein
MPLVAPLQRALLALVFASMLGCGSEDPAPTSLYAHRPSSNSGSGTASGADDGSGTKVGAGASDGTFATAAHPPMPRMVSSGGTVMTAPKVIPIFFPGDALQADIVTFVSTVGATPYWKANTAEYGVGAITAAPPVVLTQAAPATVTDQGVQQLLGNAIAKGQLPPADDNTLYTLFFPQTSTITDGDDKSCVTFGGYHMEGQTNAGRSMIYAVVPRCANFNGLTGIDMVTVAASHELIEAATDPLVVTSPAFRRPDRDHAIWGIVFTSEAGDMCAQNPDVNVKLPGFAYAVQKSWSNVAAAASHDPCAPNLPGQVYFNSAPALDDFIQVSDGKQLSSTKGVRLATGQTKTIDIALYSDAPTQGPWQVVAIDLVGRQTGTALLSFRQDVNEGKNGDHIKLTITLRGIDPTINAAPFLIQSTLGDKTTFWLGAVGN